MKSIFEQVEVRLDASRRVREGERTARPRTLSVVKLTPSLAFFILTSVLGIGLVAAEFKPDGEEDAKAVVAEPEIVTVEAFDQLVFGGMPTRRIVVCDGVQRIEVIEPTEAEARKRMESLLESEMQSAERLYSLTDPQKKKLRLSGRGDIARHFERAAELRRQCVAGKLNIRQLSKVLDEWQPRVALDSGIFGDSSLFYKTLLNTLTPEQEAQLHVFERERQARLIDSLLLSLAQKANVEWSQTDDGGKSITERRQEGRRRVVEVLLDHGTLPRNANMYFQYIVMLEVGRQQDRIKPLVTEETWNKLETQVAEAKKREPALRKAGQWPVRRSEAIDESSNTTKE